MRLSRLVGAIAAIVALTGFGVSAIAQDPRQEPIADLAGQIAAILGHGPARLMIRNISSLPVDQIPVIRKELEQDLRSLGIAASSAPNETVIRVTLSENSLEELLVAEVIRGDDSQAVVVKSGPRPALAASQSQPVQLRSERILGLSELDSLPCFPDAKPPLLAVLERQHGLIVLKQGCLLALDRSANGFFDGKGFYHLDSAQIDARDPRGLLAAVGDGDSFLVFLPGRACKGSYTPTQNSNGPPGDGWSLECHPSDDPWPLSSLSSVAPPATGAATDLSQNPPPWQTPQTTAQIHAFFSAARNYFTGVVSPSLGIDLPPFYSAAILDRPTGTALLINSIDGKVLRAASGKLTAVSGTSDWGSDFAQIHSGCGDGSQIVVSGAGNTSPGSPPTDSLRAYTIVGSTAEPKSAPLTIDGTVTAVWQSVDGKSVMAVIRNAQNEYEVDRVTALCN